jgi:hypothetical protein
MAYKESKFSQKNNNAIIPEITDITPGNLRQEGCVPDCTPGASCRNCGGSLQ